MADQLTKSLTGRLEFTCNICMSGNVRAAAELGRETPSCDGCQSSVRARAIIYMLSMELFGVPVPLPDFPRIQAIRGIGLSDFCYDERLARRLAYVNSFYHKQPKFDIVDPDPRHLGAYDFMISSEVFEHVAPPPERAFENACRVLKPTGLLLFTVPYTLDQRSTTEHFPGLNDFGLAQLRDRLVLVNRTRSGELQVFDNLCFHGGHGSTLEARVYTESDLRALLAQAGFSTVRIYAENYLPFGIVNQETWSLPIAARKQPFVLSPDAAAEVMEQWAVQRKRARRWRADYGRLKGDFHAYQKVAVEQLEKATVDLRKRTEWGDDLDRQVKERSAWGIELDQQVAAQAVTITGLQAEVKEKSHWALNANAEVERLRQHIVTANGRLWSRIGRKLGLLD